MPPPAWVRLLRPRQWYKNLIVFVAIVFARRFDDPALYPPVLLTFAAFCLLSGAVYAWNDVLDAPRDREHPKKRHRPVASHAISASGALALGGVAALAGLLLLVLVNAPTLMLGAVFLALQVGYNLLLKQHVIWDVLTIGIGFVLRALAGSTAIAVVPTAWLILCTFLFALFLGFAKRRHELVLHQSHGAAENAPAYRATMHEYSVPLVEQMTHIVATLTLAAYFLYTFFGTSAWMMFTIPFAVYGVLRYLYLIHRRDLGDEPEMIFRDRPTVVNAVTWFVVVLLVLEGVPQRFLAWLQAL